MGQISSREVIKRYRQGSMQLFSCFTDRKIPISLRYVLFLSKQKYGQIFCQTKNRVSDNSEYTLNMIRWLLGQIDTLLVL